MPPDTGNIMPPVLTEDSASAQVIHSSTGDDVKKRRSYTNATTKNNSDGCCRLSSSDVQGGITSEAEPEILVDDYGRPYDLGPEGFVRDLNIRAIKIAWRLAGRAGMRDASKIGSSRELSSSTPSIDVLRSRLPVGGVGVGDGSRGGDISGTVRTAVAQEIQFVLAGRLPFVKRSELAVWSLVCISVYFIVRHGLLGVGCALTVATFSVMYVVLDFYSGVLHVVLDDEWNMKVPLLSQPAMEFQYHHHIPDDGCSRPFVEGMGDLNVIVTIHLALYLAIYAHGGYQDSLLLCAGAWKMLFAYWGIWNHRQVRERNYQGNGSC